MKELAKKHYKRKEKKLKIFFFTLIGLYLLIKLIPIVVYSGNDTYVVKYGKVQIVHNLDCYIIRNEQLIHSNTEGNIKYFVKEGEKVKKDYNLAEIHKNTVDDDTKKKLEAINERIKNLSVNKNHLFQNDSKKLDEEIQNIIKDLREYNENGDLLRVEEYTKQLKNKLEKKRMIVGDKSFSGKNLNTLKSEKEKLEKKISQGMIQIKCPISGIASFQVDGYESILNPRNMATLKLEELEKIDENSTNLKTNKVIPTQPLLKIVDNNKWYIVTWIDSKLSENYGVGKNVTFKFPKGEIQGKIYKVLENKGKYMVIFQMDQYIDNFSSMRNMKVDVVVVNYEGLKIYKDSIVQRNGQKGVYVLDINRYAKFKPIEVIGYDDKYAIVKNNIFYEENGSQMKAIPTINLYDEIVRNAEKTKEGQWIY